MPPNVLYKPSPAKPAPANCEAMLGRGV